MDLIVRPFEKRDLEQMTEIWNEVVQDAIAFPQTEKLGKNEAEEFFSSQTLSAVAFDNESQSVLGLYILHPNNIGHCGHISNASFAVSKKQRGNGIGEKLVSDCLEKAAEFGFKILQFNAVVKSNFGARKLYEKLGFVALGVVPGGFRHNDGSFEDIVLYYHTL